MRLLLCLFGVDGAGKTTLARYIATYLRIQGFYATTVWMRGTHTIASVLARFLACFSVFRGSCNPYYKICIPSSMKQLWLWIEFISILPIILLRFVVSKLLDRVVIAERSLIDFLAWLIVTLRWSRIIRSFIGKSIISLQLSLCDRAIYVRADLDNLLARRKGCSEKRLIPIQLQIYDAIAKALQTPCINTSRKTVNESVREILEIIGVGYG